MFRYYFTSAVHNIRSNKIFSTINIAGFAFAISICLAISLFVAKEYSFDYRFKDILSGIILFTISIILKGCVLAVQRQIWDSMHKLLESFACKSELNWWIFGLEGLLALAIALLTVSLQSWRAATRNSVEVLGYE